MRIAAAMARASAIELAAMTRPRHPWELKEREPGTGRYKRETLEDVMSAAKTNRIKLGVPAAEFRNHLAGSLLGRLRMAGSLTDEQYRAGERWGRVVSRYARLMGIPAPNPRSCSATMTGGAMAHGDEPLPDGAILEIRRDYADAFSALIDCIEGRAYMSALKATVMSDQPADLGNLRCALNVLAHLWR